jgi:polysaccharide biosynthesis transport protein
MSRARAREEGRLSAPAFKSENSARSQTGAIASRFNSDWDEGSSTGADLREMIGILTRNARLIIATTAAALLIAMIYLAVTPKLYTATVSILFDSVSRAAPGVDPNSLPPPTPDATLVESQVEVIPSDTVLRRVVAEEHLESDPEFGLRPPGLLQRALAALGLAARPAPSNSIAVQDRTVGALAHAIEVKRSERTYVLDVDLSARDPGKAARLANAVARAYFEDQQAAKSDLAEHDSNWLDQRLSDLQSRVSAAESLVTKFRAANGINEANGKNVSEQELGDLATELVQARAQTAAAEAREAQIRKIEAAGELPDGTSDALRSSTLDRLRGQYAQLVQQEAEDRLTFGDRHPALLAIEAQARDTQSLITQELRRVAEATDNDYQIARTNEQDIAARLAEARQADDAKNKALAELGDLQRNADAARTIYEQFLRARETVNSEVAAGPSARVIAPAVPPLSASSPKKGLVLALALFVGVFFGSGGAFARDFLGGGAGGRATEKDAEVLAAIPRISSERGLIVRLKDWAMRPRRSEDAEQKDEDLFLDEVARRPGSIYSASIAKLWKAVAPQEAAASRRRAWTILVVSLAPQVGKTTIAANLARFAGEQGLRALLIEANPANPQLSRLIAPGAEPSLIMVSGTERVIYEVPACRKGSLHLVPILPAEARIVRRLRTRPDAFRFPGIAGHFDVVVVDGPSAEDSQDLRDLAAAADRIALTVRPEERADVDAFIEDFEITSRQLQAGLLAIVQDHSEAA